MRWIFSEKHPLENAEYAPGTFVQLLINAAQAKEQIRRRRFIIATDYYVKELLIFVKSLIPIELDRPS
ncbi:MAG: hypothetical protein WAV32_02415 [Halobacteriota archaeon]